GVIALAVAFTGYNIARLTQLGPMISGLIAVGAAATTLEPPGIVYIFSQVYDVVTAGLPYAAIFILLEVLSYRAKSQLDKRTIFIVQLSTILFCLLRGLVVLLAVCILALHSIGG